MTPKPENSVVLTHSDEKTANQNRLSMENGHTNAAFENDSKPGPLTDVVLTSLNDTPKAVSEPAKSQSPMDFDDLLPHVGEFGKYQKILFLLMIPYAFFVAFTYFTQIFITIVPDNHWCRIPELEHLTVEER